MAPPTILWKISPGHVSKSKFIFKFKTIVHLEWHIASHIYVNPSKGIFWKFKQEDLEDKIEFIYLFFHIATTVNEREVGVHICWSQTGSLVCIQHCIVGLGNSCMFILYFITFFLSANLHGALTIASLFLYR